MVAGRIQSLVRGGRNAILDLANLKAEWIPRVLAGGAVPPDSVTATPVAGSGALVIVEWVAPADLSLTTEWSAIVRPVGSVRVIDVRVVLVNDLDVQIDGLLPLTAYTVEVRGLSFLGDPSVSAPVSVDFTTLGWTAPAQPTAIDPNVMNIYNIYWVDVDWTASTQGGPVTQFTLEYRVRSTPSPQDLNPTWTNYFIVGETISATEYNHTGVGRGLQYQYRVRAEGPGGVSLWTTSNPVAIAPVVDPVNNFNTLAVGNEAPEGIWSDGITMWVSDSPDDKLYAYNLITKGYTPTEDFNTLAVANTAPDGLFSDGTTIWVADHSDSKLYAYDLITGAYDSAEDFNTLASGNSRPLGLWSDGTTMWVSDLFTPSPIFAYDLATKAYTSDENFVLTSNNLRPYGLWSNGTTMWVADFFSDKIFAYDLATKVYTPAEDFNTLGDALATVDSSPSGIWSDGITMWVCVAADLKIYAFDLATKEYIDATTSP